MIGHEQRYNLIANRVWFVLGLALMIYWLANDMGTAGSIMFGLIYFPFVLLNLIIQVAPLKIQLGIVNKFGGLGIPYFAYLVVSFVFYFVLMIILFLTKLEESHLNVSYDGTQWAGHFMFYLVFWFVQFWQVWSLWCFHHYTRQRTIYLLEANLALN